MISNLEQLPEQDGQIIGRTQSAEPYRAQSMTFARRVSELNGADEIAHELAEYVRQGSDADCVAVYLKDAREATFSLSASVGKVSFVPSIGLTAPIVSWLEMASAAAPLPAGFRSSLATPVPPTALAAPIRWRAMLVGFILLCPPRAVDRTTQHLELLTTVADQVSPAVVAARLSEEDTERRRIERLNAFTATVIHDLKNCVSALSMLARNAAANLADPQFQRDAFSTLSGTVDRMRRLLVTLSGSDAVPAPSRTEPIDLEALIIEATMPLATDGKIRLVRQLRPVTTMYGDRDAVLRVVENLMTNAAEAIEREGTVTVTLTEEQGHAIISVVDTGCGIPEEYLQHHLFVPFRSTKKGGWGIGLYQTKQVIENQSGEIFVASGEGRGTTFTVKLPLRADVESPFLESVR